LNELRLTLRLTPHGRLVLATADDAPELEAARARRIERAFARGTGHGLLLLGAAEVGSVLPPVFAYWRELGARHVCGKGATYSEGSDAGASSKRALDLAGNVLGRIPGARARRTRGGLTCTNHMHNSLKRGHVPTCHTGFQES